MIISGIIGSHSLALTSNGRLYAWGVPHATGLGSIKPVWAPLLVETFPIDSAERERRKKEKKEKSDFLNISMSSSEILNEANNTDSEETDFEIMGIVPCKEIACG